LVLITGHDKKDVKEEQKDVFADDLARSLSTEIYRYPPSSIYFISAKWWDAGRKMLAALKRLNRKPSPQDSDDEARKVAEDFISVCQGLDREESEESYLGLRYPTNTGDSRTDLIPYAQRLIGLSGMDNPMNRMIATSVNNAAVMACNKAIEKSLVGVDKLADYFGTLHETIEKDVESANTLSGICIEVQTNVERGVLEVRRHQAEKIKEFKASLKAETDVVLAELPSQLMDLADLSDDWTFDSAERAIEASQGFLREATERFTSKLDEVLEKETAKLELMAQEIEATADRVIFDQLRRISQEMQKEFPSVPKIATTAKLSTASLDVLPNMIVGKEKTATVKERFFSAFGRRAESRQTFSIDRDEMCKAVKEILTEYTKHLVSGAGLQVEKFMSKTLDNLLKQGLSLVHQVREALQERDRLRAYVTQVTAFQRKYKQYQVDLEDLLKNVREE